MYRQLLNKGKAKFLNHFYLHEMPRSMCSTICMPQYPLHLHHVYEATVLFLLTRVLGSIFPEYKGFPAHVGYCECFIGRPFVSTSPYLFKSVL